MKVLLFFALLIGLPAYAQKLPNSTETLERLRASLLAHTQAPTPGRAARLGMAVVLNPLSLPGEVQKRISLEFPETEGAPSLRRFVFEGRLDSNGESDDYVAATLLNADGLGDDVYVREREALYPQFKALFDETFRLVSAAALRPCSAGLVERRSSRMAGT